MFSNSRQRVARRNGQACRATIQSAVGEFFLPCACKPPYALHRKHASPGARARGRQGGGNSRCVRDHSARRGGSAGVECGGWARKRRGALARAKRGCAITGIDWTNRATQTCADTHSERAYELGREKCAHTGIYARISPRLIIWASNCAATGRAGKRCVNFVNFSRYLSYQCGERANQLCARAKFFAIRQRPRLSFFSHHTHPNRTPRARISRASLLPATHRAFALPASHSPLRRRHASAPSCSRYGSAHTSKDGGSSADLRHHGGGGSSRPF